MAITVSGNNPVQVTVASDTVTTNTTFNANAPNDRDYIFAANIIGSVNAGVTIGGFGLFLQSDASSNGRVAMTNNGSVAINAFTDALALEGNGGLVTYSGSGTVSNSGDGRALFLDNSNGHVTAVITNDITANTAPAVLLNTNGRGVASYTQAAGTVVSTAPNGDDVVHLVAAEGGIVANLNGTITGGTGLRAFSVGAITVNTSGTIDTDDTAILATGEGPGRVRINMTGGEVHATFGLQAIAQEGGGAVVNLSGGQIGSAAEPLDTAISVRSNGTAGNVKAITSTGTTIFAGTGILADISNEDSTGNVIVTVNGGIDLAFFGVFTDNLGTGATNITINGSVVANTGIRVLNGAASVLNTGTITGTGGTAIELGGGNDRLTITRTSVINGNVLAQGGNDTLRLGGGGVGNFDVSDLGQQYQGFEAFNVVSGTWRLTGSSGENLNVLGGTVAGTAGINVLTVAAGGTVAPGVGAGAGRIETGQFFLTGGARLAIEIGGTAAGQSDQIEVDGNVSLGGATLNLSRINGFVPTPGDNFLIIDHDAAGAINGTFGGLPEGATIFAPGSGGYRISYRGGDGNDVTLTALAFAAQGSGDFNGNGSDDLLWRHGSTGELLRWTIVDNQVQQLSLGNLDLNFAVVGTGDFDGNGSEELVYRHVGGELLVDGVSRGVLDNVFAIAAVGDFNGDGRDELVYRHANGELLVDGVSYGILDNVFSIAAVGDFNGDGRDELVYRHVNGELLVDGVSRGILDNVWTIEGVGDFNGDGRDELVIRHRNGEVRIDGVSIGVFDNNLAIEFIGDFDGNGRDELLWRHVDGSVLLNGNTIGSLDVI